MAVEVESIEDGGQRRDQWDRPYWAVLVKLAGDEVKYLFRISTVKDVGDIISCDDDRLQELLGDRPAEEVYGIYRLVGRWFSGETLEPPLGSGAFVVRSSS